MIEAIFYIESQGRDEKIVKASLDNLVKSVEKEKGVKVKNKVVEEVAKDGDNFTSNVELELEFDGLQEYLVAAMRFAPYAIILSAPNKLSMTPDEFVKVIANITAFTKMVFKKHGIRSILSGQAKKPTEDEEKDLLDKFASEEGKLTEEEIEALLDQNVLRIKMVVQVEGDEDRALKNLLRSLGPDVFVHKMKASKFEDQTLAAFHAFMYEPKTLVELSIKLVPVLIEMIEPETVKLSMLEMQDMGIELAATYFELAHMAFTKASPS
jgi:hypothetical protein